MEFAAADVARAHSALSALAPPGPVDGAPAAVASRCAVPASWRRAATLARIVDPAFVARASVAGALQPVSDGAGAVVDQLSWSALTAPDVTEASPGRAPSLGRFRADGGALEGPLAAPALGGMLVLLTSALLGLVSLPSPSNAVAWPLAPPEQLPPLRGDAARAWLPGATSGGRADTTAPRMWLTEDARHGRRGNAARSHATSCCTSSSLSSRR